ncbi:unnamed protein product [Musa banksii]
MTVSTRIRASPQYPPQAAWVWGSDVEFSRVVLWKMTQVGVSDWVGKISERAHSEKRISLENSLWSTDSGAQATLAINPCPLRTSRALLVPITCRCFNLAIN